jgi:deferrochelatase/peroxidase EfeB
LGCPLGAHVRRANPRDAGARAKASASSRAVALEAVNNHRILRRGRAFGPWLDFDRGRAPPPAPDVEERGLLFLALGADVERQFELIQQAWLLSPDFATLGGETDPLGGPEGRFTVQLRPAPLRASVRRHVRLIGGDYYFMPGLRALRFLTTDPA